MTLGSAVAFFRLHLINANLCALAALDDISGDACAFDNGCAELCGLTVDNSQNLVELNRLAGCDIQLLNEDNVALGYALLLAAGHDYSMLHEHFLPLFRTRSWGGGHTSSSLPLQCGLDRIACPRRVVNNFLLFCADFMAFQPTASLVSSARMGLPFSPLSLI